MNSFFSRGPKYSEETIKEALNALRDGVILIDKNNKIIWSNENASKWLNLNDPFSQENIRAYFPTSEFDEFLSQSCLLYTSPSPRDRTRSRMPSSA